MDPSAAARRIVARYRVAAEALLVKGDWSNFADFVKPLEACVTELEAMADLFGSASAKREAKIFAEDLNRYQKTVSKYGRWFAAYPDAGSIPAGLADDLEYWSELGRPSFTDFLDSLSEGSLAKALTRAEGQRDELEKLVHKVFDYVEGEASEEQLEKARSELRRMSFAESEKVYRALAGYSPQGLEELEGLKAWIGRILAAPTREALDRLLETWEDEVSFLGDKDAELTIEGLAEEPVFGKIEMIFGEIARSANRLYRTLGLGS